jgi:hypothetical protein
MKPDVKVLVTGNCQIEVVAQALSLMHPGIEIASLREERIDAGDQIDFALAMLETSTHWVGMFPSSRLQQELVSIAEARGVQRILLNPILFRGFHPDSVYAKSQDAYIDTSSPYHSAILLWAYCNNVPLPRALELFRDDVFAKLGYYEMYASDVEATIHGVNDAGLDSRRFWQRLRRLGPFMNTINHPVKDVLIALASEISFALELPDRQPVALERVIDGGFLNEHIWPVYPDLGRILGVRGDYCFRFGAVAHPTLEDYAVATWQSYQAIPPEDIWFERLDDARFCEVLSTATRESHGQS